MVVPENSILVGAFKDPQMVVMQYTGLKDKGGREIYEGDVVRLRNRAKLTGVVGFYQGEYAFQDNGGSYNALAALYHEGEPLEVIGNIYEHPELQKQ